jgi:hypothetical protein
LPYLAERHGLNTRWASKNPVLPKLQSNRIPAERDFCSFPDIRATDNLDSRSRLGPIGILLGAFEPSATPLDILDV